MHRKLVGAFLSVISVGILSCTTPTDDSSTLVSLNITPGDQSTTVGGSVSYTATGTLGDGSTTDLTGSVTWTAVSPSVATMSGPVATGVSVGVTLISAVDGDVSTSTALTVVAAPASLAITPVDYDAVVNESITYTATATSTSGTTSDVTATVTWNSTTPQVATIGAGGVAIARSPSQTTISATLGAVVGTTTLNVTDPVVEIDVFPASYSADVGETVPFTASGITALAIISDVTGTATWTSSNLAVATMAANVATALTEGQTTITVTLGALTDSATLTVTAPPAPSITVTPADTSVLVGTPSTYTATDELAQDITSSVAWSSSSTAVALMAANVATGVTAGQTTITATLGLVSGSTTLSVFDSASAPLYGFAGAALGSDNVDFACYDPGTSAFTGPVTQFTVSGPIFQIFYMSEPDLVVVHTDAGFDTFRPGVGCSLVPLLGNPVPSSLQYGDAAVRPGTGVVGLGNLFTDDEVSFFEFSASGAATPLPSLDLGALLVSGRVSSLAWQDDQVNPPKIAGKFGNGLGDFVAVGSVTTGSGGPFTVVDDTVTAAPETAGWVASRAPNGFLVGFGSEAQAFRIPVDQPVPTGSAPVSAVSPRNLEFDYTNRCLFGFPGLTSGASYQYFTINGSQEITASGGSNVTSLAQVYRFNAFPDANQVFAFGRVSGGILTAIVLDTDLDCRVTAVGAEVALTAAGVPFPGSEQYEAAAAFKLH